MTGVAFFGIAACSGSGPPPDEYVLGATPTAAAASITQTGLPIVELKRVQLPDYLDTTAILERKGNQLVASATGRWGERLSIGMGRALAAALAARLPGMIVTAMAPVQRPKWQILMDVAAFEARDDRQVVLVARWTIADGSSREIVTAEQASLVKPVAGNDDHSVVAAMSHAIEELADQLAVRIESHRRRG